MRKRKAPTVEDVETRSLELQNEANGLSRMRSDAAVLAAEYIIANPEYYSRGLSLGIAFLHATDKADGRLAKWAKQRLQSAVPEGETYKINNPALAAAIEAGGKYDERADKRLNHAIFGSIAIREAMNGHYGYAGLVGSLDALMATRDVGVSHLRDHSEVENSRKDAQKSGKRKQALLAAASVLATSRFARSPENSREWTAGRIAVGALMVAGTVMSGVSAVDVYHSLRGNTQEPITEILLVTEPSSEATDSVW